MRNYQSQKSNPYTLPHNLYARTLYLIRDYDRLKAEVNNILFSSPPPSDGQPTAHGNNVSQTETKAIRLAIIKSEMEAVERALNEVPEFYRSGIIDNITNYSRYPIGASSRTFKRYKQKFIFYVAKNLSWI